MASCTQVERLLQAYVDGELGASERVILEQHVSECRLCRTLLAQHQRSSALLFEAFADDRLPRDLTQSVLEHLPEMDRPKVDVQAVNWRAKHPVNHWHTAAKLAPALTAIVLLILAVTIMMKWPPSQALRPEVVGAVVQAAGQTQGVLLGAVERSQARVRDYVHSGQRFETGSGSTMMFALRGPTEVKLNENTRVKVQSDRRIRVERGEVWLNVGRDGRLFRVDTPTGGVVVFGTRFDVSVHGDRAVVVVEEGRVQVENEITFREVEPGQQVDLVIGERALVPKQVDAGRQTQWARHIRADQHAKAFFQKNIQDEASAVSPQLPQEQMFMVLANPDDLTRTVKAIYVEWTPDGSAGGHCAYDMYVSDDTHPLFKCRLDNRLFADKKVSRFRADVPGHAARNSEVLYIRLVPDYSEGVIGTTFSGVKAGRQLN